jgi:lysophospholipase L1-like esterase
MMETACHAGAFSGQMRATPIIPMFSHRRSLFVPLRCLSLFGALVFTLGSLWGADAPAGQAAPGTAAPTAPAPAPRAGARGGRPVAIPPGPPAPVPAAVAIPRPTTAELARINAEIQERVATDNSPDAPLLKKYQSLLVVQAPRANTAIAPQLNPGYMTKHNNNLEAAKQGDVDILFMGDSITDNWRNAGDPANPASQHKAVFDQYYGSLKTANFGVGGDTTQGVLWRLMNGEGQGFQPKVVMLLIGTNNGGNAPANTTAEIAEGVGAVVLELRKDFPAAKILLLGIFPRDVPGSTLRKTVLDVNPLIARLDDREHVFFMDIGDKFLDAGGNLAPDIMPDKLHPTAKGYIIWSEAVKEPLAKLLKGEAP